MNASARFEANATEVSPPECPTNVARQAEDEEDVPEETSLERDPPLAPPLLVVRSRSQRRASRSAPHDANALGSARLDARPRMTFACASNEDTCAPPPSSETSQTRTTRSFPPDIASAREEAPPGPSLGSFPPRCPGPKHAASTGPSCPVMTSVSSPARASHNTTVPSSEAESADTPSSDAATARTAPSCPLIVRSTFPVSDRLAEILRTRASAPPVSAGRSADERSKARRLRSRVARRRRR